MYQRYYYHPDHLGSSAWITDASGDTYQHLQYLPYGENWVEQRLGTFSTPYQFSGKEKDQETSYNYFGARYYDSELSVWLSVDALSDKQAQLTPYCFVANNPNVLIDPDGLHPKGILTKQSDGTYRYTQSASHLLHLVSGTSETAISRVVINMRAPGQYRPWYSIKETGGGAITVGSSQYDATITFTENYFDDNPSSNYGHGYGQNVDEWLDLSSHEVGHLPQIDKSGGMIGYLGKIIGEYIQFGHEKAPMEIEADIGQNTYRQFRNFVNKKYGKNTLDNLMKATPETDGARGTESYKVQKIDQYWKDYQKSLEHEG